MTNPRELAKRLVEALERRTAAPEPSFRAEQADVLEAVLADMQGSAKQSPGAAETRWQLLRHLIGEPEPSARIACRFYLRWDNN